MHERKDVNGTFIGITIDGVGEQTTSAKFKTDIWEGGSVILKKRDNEISGIDWTILFCNNIVFGIRSE